MAASMDAVPIPNLAYYLVVNVRRFICRFRQKRHGFARQGWQESNPRPPGWSRLSVPLDYTPSRCFVRFCSWPGTQKSRPPSEAAPQRPRPGKVLVMPLRAPPGVDLDPIEGLRLQRFGHCSPARRKKAFQALYVPGGPAASRVDVPHAHNRTGRRSLMESDFLFLPTFVPNHLILCV